MNFKPGHLYHIYNQGNNRQAIYLTHKDYLAFTKLTRAYLLPHTEIIAYCLMPNHFHFMIYTDERCLQLKKQGGLYIDVITNGFRKLLSSYARIFNSHYQKTGSLFRQKTKSKSLTDIAPGERSPTSLKPEEYYAICFNYIHQNPLISGLVEKMEDWEYSSFKDYAGLRSGTLCNKELASKICLYDAENFMEVSYNRIPEKNINVLK